MKSLDLTNIDLTKPVQTRDGRKARIVCVDAKGQQPIVALVADPLDNESEDRYYLNGHFFPGCYETAEDLVNVPPAVVKATLFVNVYHDGNTSSHDSGVAANIFAGRRIECVRIDITVGRSGNAYTFTKQPA